MKSNRITSARHSSNTLVSRSQFKPILFSTPMVEAIINGSKTQTRRLIKPLQNINANYLGHADLGDGEEYDFCASGWRNPDIVLKSKYNVGNILWVRETWRLTDFLHPSDDNYGFVYKASENGKLWQSSDESWNWKPSIFMPKEACRLFLEVTNIKVERLQEISEDDAIAEGVDKEFDTYLDYEQKDTLGSYYLLSARDSYESLWAKINGQKSWDENPYVWVITFKVVECPQGFC